MKNLKATIRSATLILILSIICETTTARKQSRRQLGKTQKVAKSRERVLTMWWVLFNKPNKCEGGKGEVKCGISDIMENNEGGTNKPEISIIHASGGISDKRGFIRMTSTLYKSQCALKLGPNDSGQYTFGGPSSFSTDTSLGYCPSDTATTEVHLVIRDHGTPTDDILLQMTRFTDPSCKQVDGPNTCADIGTTGFPQMKKDDTVKNDVVRFPRFPIGCAIAGNCTRIEEAIQLQSEDSNEVTIIRVGDSLQVVAELNIPRVRVPKSKISRVFD